MEVARAGDGQNVFVQHTARNSNNQKFTIKYVDNTTVDRKYSKGELNKEFGFKTGIPFSIYTQMPCGKVIDIVGNNLVVKRKNGFKSQKWIFNDDDRTIQSVEFQDQSMGIHANGKNRGVEMQKTSNKWFQSFKLVNGNIVNARGLVLEVEANKC
jgi:nitrous oxidase accessory protein NosD